MCFTPSSKVDLKAFFVPFSSLVTHFFSSVFVGSESPRGEISFFREEEGEGDDEFGHTRDGEGEGVGDVEWGTGRPGGRVEGVITREGEEEERK